MGVAEYQNLGDVPQIISANFYWRLGHIGLIWETFVNVDWTTSEKVLWKEDKKMKLSENLAVHDMTTRSLGTSEKWP